MKEHGGLVTANGTETPDVKTPKRRASNDSGKSCLLCCRRFLARDGALLVLTLVGVVVGFALGFTLYALPGIEPAALLWVGLPGELFMRMLKAAVLPLIVSSIIAGTAGLKPKDNGRVSGVALTYIIVTNIMGAVTGTVLAVIVRPGAGGGSEKDGQTVDTGNLQTTDLFADLIRNLAPDNIVTAAFQKTQTRYRDHVTSDNVTQHVPYLSTSGGSNVLGIVVVSAALGMTAAQQGTMARPFLDFFEGASHIIFRLIQMIVWLTPIGVASLIAKTLGSSEDLVTSFRGVGLLILAHVIGDVIVGVVLTSLIYLIFQRKNPMVFLGGASRAIITAMASSSSAVAMPEVLNCLESRHQVDPRVSRFVVPLAVALNRDGSAMFIACTSVYMAQLASADTANNIILITLLTAVGSMAIPAVPSASIVTIIMVLASTRIVAANIGIIIALEWFSDRMRSTPNAISHVLAGVLTWHFCKDSLSFRDPLPHTHTHTAEKKVPLASVLSSQEENGEAAKLGSVLSTRL